MTEEEYLFEPSEQDKIIRHIRKYCEPETCAAITFENLANNFENREIAESTLKALWKDGLVEPTKYESDPEDGALIEVPELIIEKPIKDATQFILSPLGFETVDQLYVSTIENEEYTQHETADLKASINAISDEIVIVSSNINDHLLAEFNKDPEKILSLSPRQFEEFVAELFRKDGFSAEVTPFVNDGGKDVIAIKNDKFGPQLYFAECKKYAPDRPVGVGYVRSLYGVVQKEKATKGILVTTSYFTSGAKEFVKEEKYSMGLVNYEDIKSWLSKLIIK